MTDHENRWPQVGERIRSRIDALGLSYAEVERVSGVSYKTIVRYMGGEPIQRKDKKRNLATALGWSADSIDRLLVGDEPVESDVPAPTTDLEARLDHLDARLAVVIDVVAENRDNLLTLLETMRLLSRERREDAEALRRAVSGE